MLDLTMLLNAISLAMVEQPNIYLHKTFRSLVALEAIILQWSVHVNLELTYIPR